MTTRGSESPPPLAQFLHDLSLPSFNSHAAFNASPTVPDNSTRIAEGGTLTERVLSPPESYTKATRKLQTGVYLFRHQRWQNR